jgi:hypothetical protein
MAEAHSGKSAQGSTTSSRRRAKANKREEELATAVELAELPGTEPAASEVDSEAELQAPDADGQVLDLAGEDGAAGEHRRSNWRPPTFEMSLENSIEPDKIIEKHTFCQLDDILAATDPANAASHTFSISDFFEIQNGYLFKFSVEDRNFFYILGYNLFGSKYTPILIIYEYFFEIGKKPEKLEEVALNNKYLLLRAINSQLVYVSGEFLYYFKIENNDTD